MAETFGIWVYDEDGTLMLSADGFGLRIVLSGNVVLGEAHQIQAVERLTPTGLLVSDTWEIGVFDVVTFTGKLLMIFAQFDWLSFANESGRAQLYYKLVINSIWIPLGAVHRSSISGGLSQSYKISVSELLSGVLPGDYDIAITFDRNVSGTPSTFYLRSSEMKDHLGLLESGSASAQGTANTLPDTSKFWTPGEFNGYYVLLRPLGPSPEEHVIASNSDTVLTIEGTWSLDPAIADPYEIHTANAL